MNTAMHSIRIFFFASCIGLPAVTALLTGPVPLILPEAGPNISAAAFSTFISRTERGLAFVFLSLFIIFLSASGKNIFQNFFQFKERPENSSNSSPQNLRNSFIAFIPFIPLLVHNLFFTIHAYESLYLGDFDFTMISSALNRSGRGELFLRTAFVNTGPSGSFLGHHFSPSLLLYLPPYILLHFWNYIASGSPFIMDHLLYGILLWITLFTGAILWSRLNTLLLRNHVHAFFANACMAAAFPVWRLSGSFHFEILVIPLSALIFLAHFRNQKMYWIYLILALGIKEDMSFYFSLFGVFLLLSDSKKKGLQTLSASIAYFLFSYFLKKFISGDSIQDFSDYFSPEFNFSLNFKTIFILLMSFSFLPLFSPRLFFSVILPVTILHGFSRHPWHSVFYGHYIYTILPFLLLGTSLSLKRLTAAGSEQTSEKFIRSSRMEKAMKTVFGLRILNNLNLKAEFRKIPSGAFFLLFLSVIYYAAAGDKENPSVLFSEDKRFDFIQTRLHSIPENSCVRAGIPFSPHVPVHSPVFPLFIPQGNPENQGYSTACRSEFYILDLNDERPPYYTAAMLEKLKLMLEEKMILCESQSSVLIYADTAAACGVMRNSRY